MELKEGYKQTEVGVIPGDWVTRPLLNALRIPNGQVDPKEEPYRSMVLVAPDHIERDSGRLLKQETAEQQGAISGKYLFESGDIVYSKIRPYLKKAILADFKGLCSADMYPMRPQGDNCGGFMLAVILGKHFSDYADSVSVRSGMPKINRDELGDYTFASPPTKAEQEAIAEALSDADALIESLEQYIAKKRQIKQGAMQELLNGKKRLPGFSGEWELKPLAQLFDLSAAGSKSGVLQSDGAFVVMDMGSVSALGETIPTKRTSLETDLLDFGDLVMPKDDIGGGNIIGRVAFIDRDDGYVLGDHVYRLRPLDDALCPKFFYFLINGAEVNRSLRSKVAGSAQLGLGRKAVLEQVLCFPESESEQIAIANILSDMDSEIAALEAKLAKARQLKQGMMQELLTGNIRLIQPGNSHA